MRKTERDSDQSEKAMELVAYTVSGEPLALRASPAQRNWMGATHERTAYRCLPMVIANQIGWDMLCPVNFSAIWDGGHTKEAISFQFEQAESTYVSSHFGYGILTFSPGYLFRTPPGHNLWCKGPSNDPKDGISPLEGVIETDWSPYTFTMNWKFTRPGEVRFRHGEPVCTILPLPRAYLSQFDPVIRPVSENPALEQEYFSWSRSRDQFNKDLGVEESEARKQRWQKNYMLGLGNSGTEPIAGHESKLQLRAFREK